MTRYLDDVVAAYIEAAIWTGLDWDRKDESDNPAQLDENYDSDDLAPETVEAMRGDCAAFIEANGGDLEGMDAGQVGHDFWLTRNGHGAGFWDRGLGERGDRLTDAAHVYGECDLYVGDDGRLYV